MKKRIFDVKKICKSFVVLGMLAAASCVMAFKIPDAVPKPTAELKKFDIESISLRDVNFLFDVEIKNPYPVALTLDDVAFTFFVENNQFFKVNTGKGMSIRSKSSKINQFRVNIKYADVIKAVQSYAQKDYLDCKIDFVILVPLPKMPGLPKNISFDYTVNTKLPAVKPVVSVANFNVKKPSVSEITAMLAKQRKAMNPEKVSNMLNNILNGKKDDSGINPASLDIPIDVSFDINLKNETAHKLIFKDLNYSFSIFNEKLVNGVTSDIKQNGNVSVIKVVNRFSSKALSKNMLKFFDDRKGEFTFSGSTSIKLPDAIKKEPVKMMFDEKGSFDVK